MDRASAFGRPPNVFDHYQLAKAVESEARMQTLENEVQVLKNRETDLESKLYESNRRFNATLDMRMKSVLKKIRVIL